GEDPHADDRPVVSGGRAGGDRPRFTVRKDSREGEEREENSDPAPEAKPADEAAECRTQCDVSSSAAGEEVDRGCEEREQAREQDELDRPTAEERRARPDVRLGAAPHAGGR